MSSCGKKKHFEEEREPDDKAVALILKGGAGIMGANEGRQTVGDKHPLLLGFGGGIGTGSWGQSCVAGGRGGHRQWLGSSGTYLKDQRLKMPCFVPVLLPGWFPELLTLRLAL